MFCDHPLNQQRKIFFIVVNKLFLCVMKKNKFKIQPKDHI